MEKHIEIACSLGLKDIKQAASELDKVIQHCEEGRYSLADAVRLKKLAVRLKLEAEIITQCCS